MSRVLFLCRSNVARSQMAKELYDLAYPDQAEAMGVAVKKPGQRLEDVAITPFIFEVMDEVGVDMRNNIQIGIDASKLQDYDKIVAMLDNPAQLPEILQGDPRVTFWDVPDPKYMNLEETRETRDMLANKVNGLTTGVIVRAYKLEDYQAVIRLYQQSELYGGQFDEDRDSEERLRKRIEVDPEAILVAERDGEIVGAVSLIEDERVAWLFRFAVLQGNEEGIVTHALCDGALKILKEKGHNQVLIYSPASSSELNERYKGLGFNQGGNYTCYWREF